MQRPRSNLQFGSGCVAFIPSICPQQPHRGSIPGFQGMLAPARGPLPAGLNAKPPARHRLTACGINEGLSTTSLSGTFPIPRCSRKPSGSSISARSMGHLPFRDLRG